jgi:hypothetical protein
MFTVDRKRVVAFCETMLACDDKFTWECSARTDCVDRDLLELMARSGCRSVFFGIETGSRKMQQVIDKDLDLDVAREMLEVSERNGIKTTAALITGFPEEDWEDVRETLRMFIYAARHSHSHPQLNILAPLAGTPIHSLHKNEMELEDLCSDMSHQGLSQSQQDLALIRSHPDIFPNFYMIPAKQLDRDVLFELREFLSMTVECFRWLLCSIDQATDLLGFHEEWRVWRINLRGNLVGSDLRRYYVGDFFREDFLHFMSGHRLLANPAIRTLVRAEETLKIAAEVHTQARTEHIAVAVGEPLEPADVPCAKGTTRTLKLEYKLEEIVTAISARTEAEPRPEVFYATRVDNHGTLRLVEISNVMEAVIKVCDGRHTVAKVLDTLAGDLPQLETGMRSYVSEKLLNGAHAAGFVDIYRLRGISRMD